MVKELNACAPVEKPPSVKKHRASTIVHDEKYQDVPARALIHTEDREYRTHSELSVVLHSSEKEISILTFPLSTGEYDYLGFEATDLDSLTWYKDLFDYYWTKSSPVYL